MRFLLKKLDLSQQKFADRLGEKRGRIAAYLEKANAPDEFKSKLSEEFDIDLGKFLMIVMNDDNYLSFMTTNTDLVSEPSATYAKKADAIELIMKVKEESDPEERDRLIDKCVKVIAKMMEENGFLKDEINQLQKDLLAIARKA